MQEIEGSALFLFLYFSADVFLDRIKKGDLLLRWTFQPRNISMDQLCIFEPRNSDFRNGSTTKFRLVRLYLFWSLLKMT